MTPAFLSLLAQAAEWRLYGLLFEYPTPAWRAQLTALLPDLADPELRLCAEHALAHHTPGLHVALFGPAGTVPAREVHYRDGVQFGYLMAELAACYSAFGYAPSAGEADDHLAIELGFVAYLRLKEAYALAAADTAAAEITRDAAAAFLAEHLALMAEPSLPALENFAPDYLLTAGRRIARLTGPSPRSNYPLGSLTAGADDDDITCGGAAAPNDFIQLQP